MDSELESQVWQMVQKTCDKSAFVMLIEAPSIATGGHPDLMLQYDYTPR